VSLLGIEVGKRHCAVAAYSIDGHLLAQTAAVYRPAISTGVMGEVAIQPVWQTVLGALRRVIASIPKDPVQALAIAATGEGIAALDANGRPLASFFIDKVGVDSPSEVISRIGSSRLFDLTGRLPGDADGLAALCWLRAERPAVFERVWKCVPLGVALAAFLGGATVCDYSQACYALPLDTARQTWSRELLQAYQMSRRLLPELMPAGSPIGVTSSRSAEDLGLPREAHIILGGETRACQALGVGAIRGGVAALDLGTTLALCPPFNAAPLRSVMLSQGLPILNHVAPGVFLSRWTSPGERILRWFRDNLTPLEKREAKRGGKGVYDLLFSEMPHDPTDLIVLCALPHGSRGGPRGALLGVGSETSRGAIVKSLLEGMCYRLADGLGRCERVGIGIDLLRATGGGAFSDAWLQLVADTLGRPVESAPAREAGPLGAALLAGMGIGVYDGPEEAVSAAVEIASRHEPDQKRHRLYEQRASLVRSLQERLGDALAIEDGEDVAVATK